MILHRKTYDGVTNSSTVVDLSALDVLGLSQHLCDFNVEVSGNSAEVTMKGKGSFADSQMLPVTDASFAIGGGHIALNGFALSQFEFTTTGSAYKIMITRQRAGI